MQEIKLGAAALVLALLAACGTTDEERALTGAVAGAVVADVMDANVLAGAAAGAAAGALCDEAGVCN